MYTRCQACHTVHPLNAELLARGGGKFRCSKCHKVSNALEALFDQWPEASQQGVQPGDLPELGIALSLDEAVPLDDASADPVSDRPAKSIWMGVLWKVAAVVLTLTIGFNLARFFQLAVLEHPMLQPVLISLGITQAEVVAPGRNPDRIELLGRTMKPHPARPGVLLLTATIVNRSATRQSYPEVDVTLLDIRGRHLARKLFKPGDYLSSTAELRTGMAPQGHLTFSLEMLDPGAQAQGFELQFR